MSLMSVLAVSASGMEAQRSRIETLAENLANAETTRTPSGGPYLRKAVVFEAASAPPSLFADDFTQALGSNGSGVRVHEIRQDPNAVELRYQPGHPDADEEGYVAFPHINPVGEMVDLQSAARAYEANVAAVSATREMVRRSIELFRG